MCAVFVPFRFFSSIFPFSLPPFHFLFFFFNDPATPEIYPLSLHDALPIWFVHRVVGARNEWYHPHSTAFEVDRKRPIRPLFLLTGAMSGLPERVEQQIEKIVTAEGLELVRSEEHTSELQSLRHLVCRLLLA